MHILHLIDALDNRDDARRLELLALSDSGRTEVCCIGAASRQATLLRERGIIVHALGWARWLDARALWRLRELVHGGGFNIVHVWRRAALRMLAVAAADVLPRTIVSAPLPASGGLPWWDRQLLRRVRCLALSGEEERLRCMQCGLGDVPWRTIPAAAPDGDLHTPGWALRYPRRIACAGRLERDSGFREAIWAVDVLRHVFPDVHLLIAGDGPFRNNLESMIRRLTIDNAHLLGDTMDQAEVLAAADICWVPSLADRGAQTALEAMAAGRPVVASDVPCLRALIRDGDTGRLVPAGAPVALARQTRALFADPARSGQIGSAARAEAARFALPRVAARWQALYNDMAA
jgi:glycosyltransferase involved in cell wall biosynthesis